MHRIVILTDSSLYSDRRTHMSAWVKCDICGGMKEVPAFEGDGVYSTHVCKDPERDEPRYVTREMALDAGDPALEGTVY